MKIRGLKTMVIGPILLLIRMTFYLLSQHSDHLLYGHTSQYMKKEGAEATEFLRIVTNYSKS